MVGAFEKLGYKSLFLCCVRNRGVRYIRYTPCRFMIFLSRDIKTLRIFCWVRFMFCVVGRDLFAFDEDRRVGRFLNILRETILVSFFVFFV